MKRRFLLPILLMTLNACGGGTNSNSTINSSDISKIMLYFGGGMPPSQSEASTAFYSRNTVLFPDGRVEFVKSAYDGTTLESANWQVPIENFKEIVDKLNEINFFSLPEQFYWGPTDYSKNHMYVHASDKIYYSTYKTSYGDAADDTELYEIFSEGVQFFEQKTAKPA